MAGVDVIETPSLNLEFKVLPLNEAPIKSNRFYFIMRETCFQLIARYVYIKESLD